MGGFDGDIAITLASAAGVTMAPITIAGAINAGLLELVVGNVAPSTMRARNLVKKRARCVAFARPLIRSRILSSGSSSCWSPICSGP